MFSLSGILSNKEIINIFKDEPVSRAKSYRILKDCRNGKGRLLQKFNISHITVNRVIKKNNFRLYKRQSAPKYTAHPLKIIPKCWN